MLRISSLTFFIISLCVWCSWERRDLMHGKDLIMSQVVSSTSKQQSSSVVWVALLVIVSIIGGAYVMHQNTANSSATPSHPSSKTTQQVPPTGSGHSLYGPSSLSVMQINAILLAYHSPAQG